MPRCSWNRRSAAPCSEPAVCDDLCEEHALVSAVIRSEAPGEMQRRLEHLGIWYAANLGVTPHWVWRRLGPDGRWRLAALTQERAARILCLHDRQEPATLEAQLEALVIADLSRDS